MISAWWIFLLLVFLAGMFLRIPILSGAAVVLVLFSLLARWWQRQALQGVIYRRRLIYRRGFPGEQIPLMVEVENRKFLPLSWLEVDDPVALAVAPREEGVLQPTHISDIGVLINFFSLRWFERKRYHYNLYLRKRGVYPIGPPRLESGDLFGLFDAHTVDEDQIEYVTVFPEQIPAQTLRLPSDDPLGERRTRRRLYEDPNLVMGVRDYQPTDDFRRVHWPYTARMGELQVKVYQPVSTRVMVVCLNVSTMVNYWEGIQPDLLEYILGVTSTIIQRGLQDGFQVGMVSNGCLAHADRPFRVPPGRSPGQLSHLLTALAGVTMFASAPFDRFLRAEAMRMPYGASLVIVSGVVYPALVETIVRLKNKGWRMTLVSFEPQAPPKITGVQTAHLPFSRSPGGGIA